MRYCELTPSRSRGTLHVQAFAFLKDSKLEFNAESRRLVLTDCVTGEVLEVDPVCSLKIDGGSRHTQKGAYVFSVSLNLVGNKALCETENVCLLSKFYRRKHKLAVESIDSLVGLLFAFEEELKILSGFYGAKTTPEIIHLGLPGSPAPIEFRFSCRGLVIRDYSLQTIDVRSTDVGLLLTFRVAISTDRRLTDINLRAESLIHAEDLELSKASRVVLKCKHCEFELKDLSGYRPLALPSDLYLHSIGSVYCEECQGDLATEPPERIEPSKRKV